MLCTKNIKKWNIFLWWSLVRLQVFARAWKRSAPLRLGWHIKRFLFRRLETADWYFSETILTIFRTKLWKLLLISDVSTWIQVYFLQALIYQYVVSCEIFIRNQPHWYRSHWHLHNIFRTQHRCIISLRCEVKICSRGMFIKIPAM